MTLPLIITDAGRAAAITASHTQAHVVVTKVGVGSGLWSPGTSATALQNKIKDMDTVAGGNPAPGQMHFEITDETEDVYTLGEFGLYLDDGTLFAIYSQATPILSKTAQVPLLLAVDLDISTLPPGSVTFGNTDFQYPQATETSKGVDRIATEEEVATGENLFGILVPARLKAWWDSVRTWKNIKEKPTAFPPVQHGHAINEVGLNRYVGMVGYFGFKVPPKGWLEANGSECPTCAAQLNSLLNGHHGRGPNGQSLLPDLRGEFIRGWDHGRGLDPGRVLGDIQPHSLKSHHHINGLPYIANARTFYGIEDTGNRLNSFVSDGSGQYVTTSPLTSNTGESETKPRNISMMICIYAGV